MAARKWKHLPLNALRAFEAAARHSSFKRAAEELAVTPGAISHHIKGLEDRLGFQLFRRLPQGLVNTEAADRLLPLLQDSFGGLAAAIEEITAEGMNHRIHVSALNTLATGWLIPRIDAFRRSHPDVRVDLYTHNNWKVSELVDVDILSRFGHGPWPGVESFKVASGAVSPLCTPQLAARLRQPRDLLGLPLLGTYHSGEWAGWFDACGIAFADVHHHSTFDTCVSMIAAARGGYGVALAPPNLFRQELDAGALVQPFAQAVEVDGDHYLTRRMNGPTAVSSERLWSWLRAQADAGEKCCA